MRVGGSFAVTVFQLLLFLCRWYDVVGFLLILLDLRDCIENFETCYNIITHKGKFTRRSHTSLEYDTNIFRVSSYFDV